MAQVNNSICVEPNKFYTSKEYRDALQEDENLDQGLRSIIEEFNGRIQQNLRELAIVILAICTRRNDSLLYSKDGNIDFNAVKRCLAKLRGNVDFTDFLVQLLGVETSFQSFKQAQIVFEHSSILPSEINEPLELPSSLRESMETFKEYKFQQSQLQSMANSMKASPIKNKIFKFKYAQKKPVEKTELPLQNTETPNLSQYDLSHIQQQSQNRHTYKESPFDLQLSNGRTLPHPHNNRMVYHSTKTGNNETIDQIISRVQKESQSNYNQEIKNIIEKINTPQRTQKFHTERPIQQPKPKSINEELRDIENKIEELISKSKSQRQVIQLNMKQEEMGAFDVPANVSWNMENEKLESVQSKKEDLEVELDPLEKVIKKLESKKYNGGQIVNSNQDLDTQRANLGDIEEEIVPFEKKVESRSQILGRIKEMMNCS